MLGPRDRRADDDGERPGLAGGARLPGRADATLGNDGKPLRRPSGGSARGRAPSARGRGPYSPRGSWRRGRRRPGARPCPPRRWRSRRAPGGHGPWIRAIMSGTGTGRFRKVASKATIAAPAPASASISAGVAVMKTGSPGGQLLIRPMTGRSVAAATALTLASLSMRRPTQPTPATASAIARTSSTVSSGEPVTGWTETMRPPARRLSSAVFSIGGHRSAAQRCGLRGR